MQRGQLHLHLAPTPGVALFCGLKPLQGNDRQWAMIVAVIPVRMMQMTVHQVVYMVPMRYGFVPAARAVDVTWFVTCANVVRRAAHRIGITHVNRVLVYVVSVNVVHVPVMQKVHVVAVFDGRVPAAGTVLVCMFWVNVAAHDAIPFRPISCGCLNGVSRMDFLRGVMFRWTIASGVCRVGQREP